MKKKVLSVLLATAMVLSLTACGQSAEAPAATETEAVEEPAAEAEAPAPVEEAEAVDIEEIVDAE